MMVVSFLRVILILCFMMIYSACAVSSEEQPVHFLSLTDIHFNPFDSCTATPCPLIEALRQTPLSQWDDLLAKNQIKLAGYGADTNYPLLKSALTDASKRSLEQHVSWVLILGDYLSHNFKENYLQYSGDKTAEGYQAFVKNTLTFLTEEIASAFPKQDVYMAVGNNDSYVDDYVSQPNGQFYQDMAQLWGSLIKDKSVQVDMQRDFPVGGYYAINMPDVPRLRLIVLNSVLFSRKAQGTGVDQAAQQQLDWLHTQLVAAHAKQQKVLLALHIPAGIDVYASLKKTPFSVVELWKPQYTQQFQTELQRFSTDLMGIMSGHFHMDFFQVLKGDEASPSSVWVTGTPAISPAFGNNPGFKIYAYSPSALSFTNFVTYFDPLMDQGGWMEEYNFNSIYQPGCQHCRVVDGMDLLAPSGKLADHYISYFAVGTNSQPISAEHKWLPYYWCAIHHMALINYQSCLASSAKLG